MFKLALVAVCLGVALASDSYGHGGKHGYAKGKEYYKKEEYQVSHSSPYTYHGKYPGKCGKDGFYYRDYGSFVICSNGNSYVQPCAPGTQNSGHDHYTYGHSYYYRDFCDVNLVDYGYGVKHGYGGGYGGGYGHGGYGGGYGHGGYGGGYGHGGYGGGYGHGGRGGYGGGRGYGGYDHGYGGGHEYGRGYGYEKEYGYEGKHGGGHYAGGKSYGHH